MGSLIYDLYHDEMRAGFLVTTDRKKIWNVELNLLVEVDRICQNHGITYFADYGTLLGAVRHQGFIPWDDDIDLVMLRPDYERFKEIAMNEIKTPLFFQNTYTDTFVCAFSKIRDSRTTAVEFPEDYQMNQGIFVDIFPLDDVEDGSRRQTNIYQIEKELWMTIVQPADIQKAIESGNRTQIHPEVLQSLLALSCRERMNEFENFCHRHSDSSKNVNFLTDDLCGISASVPRSCYTSAVRLPFETIMLPVPEDYSTVLQRRYGEYMKYVVGDSLHEGIVLSADIPYKEYLSKVT